MQRKSLMPVQPAGISFVDETPPGGRYWREPNAQSISKIATPITDPIFHLVIIWGDTAPVHSSNRLDDIRRIVDRCIDQP